MNISIDIVDFNEIKVFIKEMYHANLYWQSFFTRCFYEVNQNIVNHFLIIMSRLLFESHKKIMNMSAFTIKRSLLVLFTNQISTTLKQTLKSTSISDSLNEHHNTCDHYHHDDKEDDHLLIIEKLLFSFKEIQESKRADLRDKHVMKRINQVVLSATIQVSWANAQDSSYDDFI